MQKGGSCQAVIDFDSSFTVFCGVNNPVKTIAFYAFALIALQSCSKSDDASSNLPPANTIRINSWDFTVTDDFRQMSDSMIFVTGLNGTSFGGVEFDFGAPVRAGDYVVAAYPPKGNQAAFIAVADSNGIERAYFSTGTGSATLTVSGSAGKYRIVLHPAPAETAPGGPAALVSANVSQQ